MQESVVELYIAFKKNPRINPRTGRIIKEYGPTQIKLKFFFKGLTFLCQLAASEGNLLNLQQIREDGYPWDSRTCDAAAQHGFLQCLKYAHDNGCSWDSTTCYSAAYNGNIDCLIYAYSHGCPFHPETCTIAACNGHLDCLIYAHQNGCLLHKQTCTVAAHYGNLDCMKYAYENGCIWDEYVLIDVTRGGHISCLKYILENTVFLTYFKNIANMPNEELNMITDTYVHIWITKIFYNIILNNAASIIKKAWTKCLYDPNYKICRLKLSKLKDHYEKYF